jgi:hypothetical protein
MNINKDYLIGGAAFAAIAFVGYFSFSMNSDTNNVATTDTDILEVVVTSDDSENSNPDNSEKHETLNAVETNTADNVVE